MSLYLSGDEAADELLSTDPLALLVGMVLDQQVPLEWAFAGPAELRRRLGRDLDAKEIAAMNPDALAAVFAARPALHRYPGSMATRVHELCRMISDDYGGRADAVWAGTTSGPELLARIRALPGFGEQKAKIFVALLGKQLGLQVDGWRDVSVPYSEPGTFRSVADITDSASLDRVRAFKQQMKAEAKATAATDGKAATKKVPATKSAAKKAPTKTASAKKSAAKKAAATKKKTTTAPVSPS